MMTLINEVLKPENRSSVHESIVPTPPLLLVSNLERGHQCDTDVSSTDPPAWNEHGHGPHNLFIEDHRERELRKKLEDEWFAEWSDRSFCWDPG
ncbi:hypothetical protein ACLKA6_012883 [Drosophila palustris]